jgi:hypothetical protein
MNKDTETTNVIFRKWNKKMDSHKGIIAMFPDEDWGAGLCLSYEHIGHHGGAVYNHVVNNSKLAKPEEYEGLKRELSEIGYKLKIVQRKGKKAIDNPKG